MVVVVVVVGVVVVWRQNTGIVICMAATSPRKEPRTTSGGPEQLHVDSPALGLFE